MVHAHVLILSYSSSMLVIAPFLAIYSAFQARLVLSLNIVIMPHIMHLTSLWDVIVQDIIIFTSTLYWC